MEKNRRGRGLNSPEFVICVSHLVRSKLWHQNFDDVDENQEVDLWEADNTKFD